MHRAVLDSSVLISAFLTPTGVPDRVLDAAERGDLILCLSAEILAETVTALLNSAKLQARYGYDRAAVEAVLGLPAVGREGERRLAAPAPFSPAW